MSRLHNSTSHTGGDLAAAAAGDSAGGAAPPQSVAQHQASGPPGAPLLSYNCHGGLAQGLANPRFAAKPFADPGPQGVPPSYEECTRQVLPRSAILDHLPTCGRPRGCSGRTAGVHRVAGGRRSRHRDNADNISYQSIGSARHSAASMRSWSACDSLGSTDTMHAAVLGPGAEAATYTNNNSSSGGGGGGSIASESTNVTLDTMSTLSSAAVSQAASCRALFGSRTSFDSSSLVTNEGAPLLEEAEEGIAAGEDCRTPDQVSQCTRDSEDAGTRDLRSPAFSLQE
ncbi:hypothetical protein FHG87_015323 [Trinorchestia longiramus]|nr:hypothetical protein FHG87_015323 [Trinorchestia longiramus]